MSESLANMRFAVVDTETTGLDPMTAELGMSLVFTTYGCGTDDNGTECVAFGYASV